MRALRSLRRNLGLHKGFRSERQHRFKKCVLSPSSNNYKLLTRAALVRESGFEIDLRLMIASLDN